MSGTMTFILSSGGVTCTESLFATSLTFANTGTMTFRSTSSVAGSGASGTMALDSNFSWTISSAFTRRTIVGPQTPANCTWTYTQVTGVLGVACNTVAVVGGTETALTGRFRVAQRVTVS